MGKRDYGTSIEKLRDKYRSKGVSLLIGSGFSKNAYSDFPNWNELLLDMIEELYSEEIKSDEDINKIIQREGYLKIVAQFEQKRGVREAIEIYIEDHIPFIDKDGKLYIPNENVRRPLSKEDLRVHEKVLQGAWEQIYTTNYDNLLEYSAQKFGKGWKEITNGYDLSFSDTKKNIIKLHGSLRTEKNRIEDTGFGFDGNLDHTYIISQNDYYEYPEKHEAFAQLMRISLLTGAFCLLGFSGDDPNFISWIAWVKDILQKSRNFNSNFQEEPKIYLISVDNCDIPREMQLFYKNHHICVIPLKNPAVQQKLNIQDGTTKELILRLLEYLYDTQKSEKIRYKDLWSRPRKVSKNEKEEMLSLSKRIGFKTNIEKQKIFLKQSIFEKDIPIERELELLAIYDTSYSIKYGLSESIAKKEFEDLPSSYQSIYTEMEWRDSTLLNKFSEKSINKLDSDFVCFERVIRNLFDLNFKKAQKVLKQWAPESIENIHFIRKAVLTSLFDLQKTRRLLLEFLNSSKGITPEKYYAVQLLNASKDFKEAPISKTDYENLGLINWIVELNKRFRDNFSNNERIGPYGENVIDYRNNRLPDIHDLNLMNLLIFLGANIRINHTVIINSKKWYNLFRRLFINYPFPCFYFSLQFGQLNILKRIGQDFAYADEIQPEVTKLLLKALENIKENEFPTKRMRNSALFICSELFKAVNPEDWENLFMEIWKNNFDKVLDKSHLYVGTLRFFEQGATFIRKQNNKLQFIEDCLSKENPNINTQINLLYALNVPKSRISEDLRDNIKKYLNKLDNPESVGVMGNIYSLLDENLKNELVEKIKFFVREKSFSYSLIHPAFFIFQEAGENPYLLKRYILESNQLWANGINKKSWSPPNFIPFSKVSKRATWTGDEIKKVYDKLKDSLLQIEGSKFFQKKDNIGFGVQEQVNLLLEMEDFLKRFYPTLKDENNYDDILYVLKSVLHRFELNNSLEKGLMSSDIASLPVYLRKLDQKLSREGIKENTLYFQIVVGRFMNKREDGLRYCLSFLRRALKSDVGKNEVPEQITQMLELGINQYSKEDLSELNLDTYEATYHLIGIAKFLKARGFSSERIDYWNRIDIERRFNFD